MSLINNVGKSFDNYKKLTTIYEELSSIENSKITHLEILKNDIELLENLHLKKNEYRSLLEKRNLITKHEKIFLSINNIYNLLDDEGDSILSKVERENINLDKAFSEVDKPNNIKELQNSLNNILIEGKDILMTISKIKDNFAFDQKELNSIEQRLFDVSNISRRFKIQPEALENKLYSMKEEAKSFDESTEKLEKIKDKLIISRKKFEEDCKKLNENRVTSARQIENLINAELGPLKLDGASFNVEIEKKEFNKWSKDGCDSIKFLVSLNNGSSKGEIHKISSGGELSRLMLALNLVIAKSINKKTLIFDEIDTGISGRVAEAVASRLESLSKDQQVLVVTHLPQVAAKGTNHYTASKKLYENGICTIVNKLSQSDRVEEIAKMISGKIITDEARKLSNKLLKKN